MTLGVHILNKALYNKEGRLT
ncbi:MAG: hypothetical protein RI985_1274, partial [Chloroflexota bacterium]